MLAAFAGGIAVLGLIIALRGAFPEQENLRARLGEFSDLKNAQGPLEEETSIFDQIALGLFNVMTGEDRASVDSDLLVTETSAQEFATEKFTYALGIGFLLPFMAFVLGIYRNGFGLLMLGLVLGLVGYIYPDRELKDKAKARRAEFGRALNSWVTLVSIGISGGGGLNTAMADASAMGRGWVFRRLRLTLEEATLEQIPPWIALMQLANLVKVEPLEELAGALTLAGNSGARITDTLLARADSGRSKELSEVREEAEEQSTRMGVPVGIMMFILVAFIGYPAITSIISSTS